ncbi:sarcosine oxidase subunit alpha family protein [Aureimonas leprariae]|uniref:Sarcosine oxidase subunit alpha family protein n=1 Tax=Plantimonas leprariae TaxID=2615207 RepID=A0A7V7TY23_9HYPH|nr:sarcosine oxidase subunit alpha family protein [Aureimonas leprariae]KAB0682725.1 sarcosine oxidase subunit alpha family protein [Aureimonas leprariae]
MSQSHRLATGGQIDRARRLGFEFDGRRMQGHAGDTLASALLANGVKLVGRSFKYHRPRGVVTAGPEEPNALVELRDGARREPNTKATTVELYDGLAARSQNRWPSLERDVGAVNGLFSPLFVAGFYYKTFKWPSVFWEKVYEPAIRRAAGLGRVSGLEDPDSYEKAFAFCDLLVIGSGAAGLSAALAAGRAGARVILCEEDHALGGRLLCETENEVDSMPAAEWAKAALAELASLDNVTLMPRTVAFGSYDGDTFGALEKVADHLPVPPPGQPRQRLWQIVARRTVLAAGAMERPLVFSGNDRPGVMLAAAVRSYLHRFGVLPGRRVVVFTNNDDGWRTAFDLAGAGAEVEAVVDARRDVRGDLAERARRLGARLLPGGRIVATHGGRTLEQVSMVDGEGREHRVVADLLAMSGGFNPTLALTTHRGAKPIWSEAIAAFVPGDPPARMRVAGAAAGAFGLGAALRQGFEAGTEAAADCGAAGSSGRAPASPEDRPFGIAPLWHVEGRGKAFVDFQNDVTASDVVLAHREGFRSVELLKRYTTLGMATDQGKLSNANGHAMMAGLVGKTMTDVGTTVSRPPHVPVAIAAFAGHSRGRHFKPTRLTAGQAWAERQGATFVEAGQWLRAQWFAAPGETDWLQTVSREAKGVRESVGICDVSTLGKIDLQGEGAAELLNRAYVNAFAQLPVGKARYGAMLREDGFVMDDGTVARLAPDHFVLSATTANAARVMKHLNFVAQVLCPSLDVQLASVTEAWVQYSVAGPNARRLLQAMLGEAIDLSNAAFPFMGVAEFEWAGVLARLFRISFSGELAYEIAVPANYGEALAERLMEAGRPFGVVPYGTEALGVLRIEKGHVAGNELNGTTTAADLGLGRMMSTKKDFVGRTLSQREGLLDPKRIRFVGFKPVDRTARLSGGAHFLDLGAEATTANDLGYVTSVAFSPTLGHWVGLGLLRGGMERAGERLRAVDLLRRSDVEIEICSPVFVDPEGARVHA